MENSATTSKPSHSTQPDQKTFIDPSYLKKGGTLPQKRFSFLTFSLFIILITSLWIFLVTIAMLPNPFLQNSDIGAFIPRLPKKSLSVQLENEYQNPFDKNTQYVNPFSSYKNPFDTLK